MGGFGQGSGFGGGGGTNRRGGKRAIPYKNPHEDPLADLPEDLGNMEEEAAAVTEAVSEKFKSFIARNDAEKSRFEYAVDADFWCGLCFHTRDDLYKFLEAAGVTRLYRGAHVDGYELAKCLGLDIDFEYKP